MGHLGSKAMVGVWCVVDGVVLHHRVHLLVHDVEGDRARELKGAVGRESVGPKWPGQEHIRRHIQVTVALLELQHIGLFPAGGRQRPLYCAAQHTHMRQCVSV